MYESITLFLYLSFLGSIKLSYDIVKNGTRNKMSWSFLCTSKLNESRFNVLNHDRNNEGFNWKVCLFSSQMSSSILPKFNMFLPPRFIKDNILYAYSSNCSDIMLPTVYNYFSFRFCCSSVCIFQRFPALTSRTHSCDIVPIYEAFFLSPSDNLLLPLLFRMFVQNVHL